MITLPNFDVGIARACLRASGACYVSPASFETGVAHLRDTAVRIETAAGEMPVRIFAFRGTANMRDWITDCECAFTPAFYPNPYGERVHAGFLAAINSVSGELIERANWSQGAKMPIYLCGHSLGGALAILAAWTLERHGLPVAGVYTFGGPRVGNGSWRNTYEGASGLGQRTFRFVNEEDIVPRVPGWLLGYRHVGHELFFPSMVGGVIQDAPWWDKLVSDGVGTWLDWKRGRVAQLEDHHFSRYVMRFDRVTGATDRIPASNYPASN